MQSNQFIISVVLFSNVLAQALSQIGGQAPLPGQPQVGFSQPPTQQWSNTGSQGSSTNPQSSWSRPAASQPAWPQGASQPAWPQQGQAPMAGQPQAGFTTPSQNQPTTAQRLPNAGVPQPAGANLQGSWASPQGESWVGQGVPQQPATNPQSPQGVPPQAANPQVADVNGAPVAGSQPAQAGPAGIAPDTGVIQEIPIDNVGDLNSNGEITGTVPFNTPVENQPAAAPMPTETSNASNNFWSLAIKILGILSLFLF